MADYHAILKKAIGALPEATGEARRGVYEKARTALVAQLKSFDPPLSASEITQQRLQLEDAIRKVEAEAAKGYLSQALTRAGAATPSTPAAAPAAAPTTKQAVTAAASAAAAKTAPAAKPAAKPAAAAPTPAPTPTPTRSSGPAPSKVPPPPPAGRASEPAPPPPAPRQLPPATTGDMIRRRVEIDRQTAARAAEVAQARVDAFTPPSLEATPPRHSAAAHRRQPEPEPVEPDEADGEDYAAPPQRQARDSRDQREQRDQRDSRDQREARDQRDHAGGRESREPREHHVAREPREHHVAREPRAVHHGRAEAASAAEVQVQAEPARSRLVTEIPANGSPKRDERKRRFDPVAQRSGRQPAVAPEVLRQQLEPSKRPLYIGLSVVGIVIAIGVAALWTQRDTISAMLGGVKPILEQGLPKSAGSQLTPKATDRLVAEDGQAAKPSAQSTARAVTTQPITAQPDVQPAPGATTTAPSTPVKPADAPAAGNPSPSTTAPQATAALASTQTVPPVAQRAVLYEEGQAGSSQPTVSAGKVIWQASSEVLTPGKPAVTVLRARIDIPERNVVVALSMKPNVDPSLPASHLVEIKFTLPGDFDGKGVKDVPGIIMKPTEQALGDKLISARAKISNGLFWIALSAPEADKLRNLTLLRDRGWIDIPIQYENDRRAIITLEKVGAGDRAVADALTAWGQSGGG